MLTTVKISDYGTITNQFHVSVCLYAQHNSVLFSIISSPFKNTIKMNL